MKIILRKLKKKKGPAPYEAAGFRSGFVILFAITISGILLAIALGIANIAFHEINFTTSARDSNDAFFAADTGSECALANDKSGSSSFVQTGGSGSVHCLDTDYPLTASGSPATSWSFTIPGLGSSSLSCSKVTVSKDYTSMPPFISTTVTSDGYGPGDPSCNTASSNRLDRQLQVTYTTNPATTFNIPTPLAFWKLDGNPYDSAAGAKDLTDHGAVTYTSGIQDQAGEFDASTPQYFSRDTDSDLEIGNNPFTIAAWVKISSAGTLRVITSKRDDDTNTEWLLIYDNTTHKFKFITYNVAGGFISANPAGQIVSTASNVNPSQWYFVVAWRDKVNHTVNIQVDNQAVPDSASENSAPGTSTAPFRIGYTSSASTAWDGLIDQVGFWKQVLTPEQRTALYDNGYGWTYISNGGIADSGTAQPPATPPPPTTPPPPPPPPPPPSPPPSPLGGVSVSPNSGTLAAGAHTFTTVYHDPDGGASDMQYVLFLINSGINGDSSALYGLYYPGSNQCDLYNSMDDSDNTVGSWTAHAWGAVPQTLPWVTLNSCSSTSSGNDLTVLWNTTFNSWSEANMSEYLYVMNNSSVNSGWSSPLGTITAAASAPPPPPPSPPSSPAVTLTPSSSSVPAGTDVTLTYSSANVDHCNGSTSGGTSLLGGPLAMPNGAPHAALNQTTTFTIQCYNSDYSVLLASTSTTVTVTAAIPTDVVFDNNSFESPDLGNAQYQYNPSGAGWDFSSAGIRSNNSAWGAPNALDGSQVAFIQTTGSISQAANMNAGSYTLSFYTSRRGCCGGTEIEPLKISIDGNQIGGLIYPSGYTFEHITVPITISSSGSHTLMIEGTDASGDYSAFVELVTMTAN